MGFGQYDGEYCHTASSVFLILLKFPYYKIDQITCVSHLYSCFESFGQSSTIIFFFKEKYCGHVTTFVRGNYVPRQLDNDPNLRTVTPV